MASQAAAEADNGGASETRNPGTSRQAGACLPAKSSLVRMNRWTDPSIVCTRAMSSVTLTTQLVTVGDKVSQLAIFEMVRKGQGHTFLHFPK